MHKNFYFSNTKERKRGAYEKKRCLCIGTDFYGFTDLGGICIVFRIPSSGVPKWYFHMKQVLYIKIDQSNLVLNPQVKFEDVVQMECVDSCVVNRLKKEKLMEISKDDKCKMVVSVLYVIQKIHEIYPDLEVQNMGETDFIVGLKPKNPSKFTELMKVFFVCLITFFGSVFAMMTFNEDVSSLDSFRKVYTWVMGIPPEGASILELSYSVGVGIGIVVFFNHFGKKQLTREPSPVEVEMSGYDKQVYATVIQHAGRKGQEKDVS